MSQKVNIKKLSSNACIPTYGTEFSAGADLYSGMPDAVTIAPGTTEFTKTGIAMKKDISSFSRLLKREEHIL